MRILCFSHLNRVPRLRRDALHGEDYLEGVLGDVPGTHLVQGRLREQNQSDDWMDDFEMIQRCKFIEKLQRTV